MSYRVPFSTTTDTVGRPPFGPSLGVPGMGPVYTGPSSLQANVQSLPEANNSSFNGPSHKYSGTIRTTYTLAVRLGSKQQHEILNSLQFNNLIFVSEHAVSSRFVPGFVQAMTLSALNNHLRSDAGMRSFGSQRTCDELVSKWRYMGVQQTDLTDKVYGYRQDAAVTVFVSYRVRTPDIWLATGTVAKMGDQLWLVLVRRQHRDLVESVLTLDDMDAIDEHHPKMKWDDDDDSDEDDKDEKKNGNEQFYWQYEPYISRDKRPPPREIYSGPDWIGRSLFIGNVRFRYNDATDITGWQSTALRALCPQNLAEGKELMNQLPDVEVMLGCR